MEQWNVSAVLWVSKPRTPCMRMLSGEAVDAVGKGLDNAMNGTATCPKKGMVDGTAQTISHDE